MRTADETTLWVIEDGPHCTIRRYDDQRYQLRLLRRAGTVKADLFADYGQALAVSDEWRRQATAATHTAEGDDPDSGQHDSNRRRTAHDI